MTREFNTSPIQSLLRSTISQEDAGSHAVDCEKIKVGGETNLVPRAFPLKKWVAPHPFFKGKALGTRLRGDC